MAQGRVVHGMALHVILSVMEARGLVRNIRYFLFYFFLKIIYLLIREREHREEEEERWRSGLPTEQGAQHGTQSQDPWNHDLSQRQMLNQQNHPDDTIRYFLEGSLWLVSGE